MTSMPEIESAPAVIASFGRPHWATDREPLDGGISWTRTASITPTEVSKIPHASLVIELVQDDFFDAGHDGVVSVSRHPAQILLGGHAAIDVASVPKLIQALTELFEAFSAADAPAL